MNDESVLKALNEVPTQVEDWTDAIAAWNRDPDEENYIIFEGETPVGWLGINGLLSEDRRAYIKMLAILPQYQSRGIGSYAVSRCVKYLKSRNYVSAALYMDQKNVCGQRCYAKCGFQVTEDLVEEMSNGISVARYRMELSF